MKEAMIFAAGIGSRLKPITDTIPKALVEINGLTALERTIINLQKNGIEKIIVNVYHHAEQVKEFLRLRNNFKSEIIISDESELLRDTGGGLKFAEKYFTKKEPILLHNADILSNIDFAELYSQMKNLDLFAVLAVQKRETSRYFLFNQSQQLVGYGKNGNDEIYNQKYQHEINLGIAVKPHRYGFTGISLVSPEIFNFMENGVYSIRDTYLALADKKISALNCDNNFWFDIGSVEKLSHADTFYRRYNL